MEQQKHKTATKIDAKIRRNGLVHNNRHIPDVLHDILKNKWLVEPGSLASQISRLCSNVKILLQF